jgi:hypothetical protein
LRVKNGQTAHKSENNLSNCRFRRKTTMLAGKWAGKRRAKAYTFDSRFDDAIERWFFSEAACLVLSRLVRLVGHHAGSFLIQPGKQKWVEKHLSGSCIVGKKLYVGNLSYSVTSASLEEMFAEFGSVRSAQVIEDRDTGRSKGFGFVEMADDNAANDAIKGLNEKVHDGRPLTVNEAKPREERGGGGGGGGYGGGRGGNRGRRY